MSDSDSIVRLPRKCPICGKPTVEATKPFCSKRCADIDLSRWLKGVYAIPVEESNAAADSEDSEDDPYRRER
ncbi:DNA gyrase inhibitor YacG [Labrys monachus]|uniref:DNA gyrase inhibitor YacG n=1 Tax=Labrys monachus TaxID=217067 RepID=A0ABU0FLK0_9HYPH|nr:DNA gyrase inhibitor YacG [Labrys monachus]MDQ0394994.1 endogenous inhibitor of DNA gyrase (YacG/DUF329 family) [Labrys monachus]